MGFKRACSTVSTTFTFSTILGNIIRVFGYVCNYFNLHCAFVTMYEDRTSSFHLNSFKFKVVKEIDWSIIVHGQAIILQLCVFLSLAFIIYYS